MPLTFTFHIWEYIITISVKKSKKKQNRHPAR